MLYLQNSAFLPDLYDSLTDVFSNDASSPASPLFLACAFGSLEILKRLEVIEALDWHQQNELSTSDIHIAARHAYPDTVEFLLHKGVKTNAKTSSGETVLHRAAQQRLTPAVKLLLAEGAHVADKDDEGWAALDMSMRRKDEDIILLLLQNGAKAEALAKYGEMVAFWHDQRGHGTFRLRDFLGRPTGYVGLLNEGYTGYLITVLQLFYMLRPVHQVSFSILRDRKC